MKILSWNVNGFRAIYKKGFKEDVLSSDPDVICLQETKLSQSDLPGDYLNDEYFRSFHQEWYSARKRGYSGVCILSKKEPLSVIRGLSHEQFDEEGRVLTFEYDDFFLICAYFPNAQEKLARLPYKLDFNQALLHFMETLREKKEVVLTGDLNVAHREIDLTNPKTNQFNPGFSAEERRFFDQLLEKGYVDIFRRQNPDTIAYTWWSYRSNAREKNVGWRIDYYLCHENFYPRVDSMTIRSEVMGSDHCPIEITLRCEGQSPVRGD